MNYFVSYTSADSSWAHWIGYILVDRGKKAFIHEWEVEAGQNISGWMERRLNEADRVIAIISPDYISNQAYSMSERLAAYWKSPKSDPFLIPVVVREVENLPILIDNLKRIHLHGMFEKQAEDALVNFLTPPSRPQVRPEFPGIES